MSATAEAPAGLATEAARRRTFAIISHPDAGKTTLTEKLLLYGGAVTEAGAVDAKRSRRSTASDWMEIERTRGISVSSTVLRFEHGGLVHNLLDTPGHRDFSEDTLRVLAAADAAVVLLDAARGVEPQTLRLFEVARARRIPLLTFVNKYDRPGMEPLAMLDHIEEVLGITPVAATWPVGIPGDFRGVIDRATGDFHRYVRTAGGATQAPEEVLPAERAREHAGEALDLALEELDLLEGAGATFDPEAFATGDCTPVLFGSALSNFGVELLLGRLEELAPPPRPRALAGGGHRPLDAPFSAFVFKVQANMDPRHRDRIAFLRICSGRFERGMRVSNTRTGRPFAMAYAHELFGDTRVALDEAFPGDVIGVVNAADLRVGDTLSADGKVEFPPIPTLAPEHFVVVRNRDSAKHKQFQKGLEQLGQEGVVHVLRRDPVADPNPVLAGVGPLQFDVAVDRLEREFGAAVGLEPASSSVRRTGRGDVLFRPDGTPLALFRTTFLLERFEREHPDVLLDRLLTR